MRRFEDVVLNQNGQPVGGAQVTVFLPGTSTKATLYSDDGITVLANPVTTNVNNGPNPGVFSFFIASGKYDFQVSGGNISTYTQRNVQIDDIFEFKVSDTQPWQTQTLEFTNQASGPTPPLGNVNLYSKIVDKNLYFKDDTGREVGPLGSGGGGGSPALPLNSIQKNNAGSLGAANATDNGTLFSINEDASFSGSNPYVDIRAFGARAVTIVPTTTATISAGSSTASLAAASSFQNGDGIVIYGAGTTNSLITPGVPVVTSSLSKGLIGTFEVVTANAGSTSYSYQIVARDKQGALTAAGSAGSTTTGLATLGSVTVSVSSWSRVNNTVTVNTSVATDLVVGATIWIQGAADPTFNGAYQVATVLSGTQFTFVSGVDTRTGSAVPTTTTGGTITYYNCNHLTWIPVAGAWQYYVYGRSGGSLTLLGVTRPLEARFDDWGSTLMGSPSFPSYVPNTPPSVATNDPLVTTIVSGAGTTSLTLANAATNSVSGAVAKFDNAPLLLAARTNAGTASLYIPSTSTGTFVVNSYLNLTPFGATSILQAGTLTLNETMEVTTGLVWQGLAGVQSQPGIWSMGAPVACNANPCVYDNSLGGNVRVERLVLQNPNDQALLWLVEGAGGFFRTYEYMHFVTGNSGINEDYLGISFLARAGTKYTMRKCSAVPHMNNSGVMGLFAPVVLMTGNEAVAGVVGGPNPAGSLDIKELLTYSKGVNVDATVANSTVILTADGYYTQGPRTPIFTFTQGFGGNLADFITIKNTVTDTGAAPLIANLSSTVNGLILENIFAASSGQINVTGNPISYILVNSSTGPLGPTTGVQAGSSFGSNFVSVNSLGYIGTILPAPAAPTLSATAGSGWGPGTFFYAITAVDINGNESLLGAPTSIVLSGPSTVTVTPPILPSGSIGWQPYVSTDGGFTFGLASHNHIGGCSVFITSGTVFLDQDAFRCNNHGPQPPQGAQSSIGAPGISTPTFRLMNSGFYTLFDYPANLTANRNIHVPNVTGTWGFTDVAQTFSQPQTFQGNVFSTGTIFASLGAPANGAFIYCSDCTIANPCTSGGTGAFAKRLNSTWVCN